MTDKKISELKEKKLIEIILNKRDQQLNISSDNIIQSYHDDAAIQENDSCYTVLTTDMLIQESHFPKKMTYYQMGEKIVTVNVSDILAMNAKPKSILIAMGLPKSLKIVEYKSLIQGILDQCQKYNITLIGGDINQNNQIILSGTATGIVDTNIKFQSGIKEDNLVAVTGKLGSPAAALELLNNPERHKNIPFNKKEEITKTLLEPDIPIDIAEYLRRYPTIVTSITDITDGLASELGQLQKQNKDIGFIIEKEKLPYDPIINKIAKQANTDLNEYIYHFGEEFELLLTLNKEEYNKHKKNLPPFYIIGKTNKSKKIIEKENNQINIIQPKGYEHL